MDDLSVALVQLHSVREGIGQIADLVGSVLGDEPGVDSEGGGVDVVVAVDPESPDVDVRVGSSHHRGIVIVFLQIDGEEEQVPPADYVSLEVHLEDLVAD